MVKLKILTVYSEKVIILFDITEVKLADHVYFKVLNYYHVKIKQIEYRYVLC